MNYTHQSLWVSTTITNHLYFSYVEPQNRTMATDKSCRLTEFMFLYRQQSHSFSSNSTGSKIWNVHFGFPRTARCSSIQWMFQRILLPNDANVYSIQQWHRCDTMHHTKFDKATILLVSRPMGNQPYTHALYSPCCDSEAMVPHGIKATNHERQVRFDSKFDRDSRNVAIKATQHNVIRSSRGHQLSL